MFQAGIDSVSDPAKSYVAQNFMFAVTISCASSAASGCIGIACAYCLNFDLASARSSTSSLR